MATNFPTTLDTLTNPLSTDALNSPSHSAQHANANDAIEALEAKVGVDSSAVTSSHTYKIAQLETNSVTLTGSQTLTNKTLTAPVINNGIVKELEETWNVSGTAQTGTVTIDALTSSAWYFTANPSGNMTKLNIRGDASTTLNSILNVNDSLTVAVVLYCPTTSRTFQTTGIEVDGSAASIKKVVGGGGTVTIPVGGALLISVTIIKTASATFTTLTSATSYT